MSYEVSEITQTGPAIPNMQAPQMREERVIRPYAGAIKPQAQVPKAAPPPPAPLPTAGQLSLNESVKATAEETPVTPEETVTLSPQMAALARKEQKYRQRELELKKKAEELEASSAEIAELKALKLRLEAKDYSGIESLVKYDDYTKYLIEKEGATTPEQEAIRGLAQKLDSLENAQKEDVVKRFDAAINDRRIAVKGLVESTPAFPITKKLKAEEHVVEHIKTTWEKDEKDLAPEQAAKEVEAELRRRGTSWVEVMAEVDAPKLEVDAPPVDGEKQLPPLKPQIKTLTNNMSATGEIKRPQKSFQFMNDSERYAEARRRAEEKMKQGIRT